MPYIEIIFTESSKETTEILIALLSDLQYEGFEESSNQLKAFISSSLFDKPQLEEIAKQFQLKYTTTELPDINWNKEWESNFQPVIVEDFCAIRAAFHQPIKDVQHEIIITPKMSFGTGHHATTYMMIQQMQQIDFTNKQVMDFGTGTGVLAIRAKQLGAASVIAIDNDEWSIDNAAENFNKNNIVNIDLKLADKPVANNTYDIILANITRNVIQENFSLFDHCLISSGTLLLSGLLKADEKDIITLASTHRFILSKKLQRENWICLNLIKQ
ncbi:MAG: 50S ribosomal protein L11 methyltransferase [Parafilimonas sp.]|nr:50S ribosomal protein L11 methyltransferase [Parafilimonas sp.]